MALALYIVCVAAVVAGLRLTRVARTVSQTLSLLRHSLSVLENRDADDRQKEMMIRQSAMEMMRLFAVLAGKLLCILCGIFAMLWLFQASGLSPIGQVAAVGLRADGFAVTAALLVLAWLVSR